MTDTLIDTAAVWAPPEGVRVRGAIALLAGAGESVRVYDRFARRLSSDGYVVGVFETADAGAARTWLAQREETPRVLAGSDAGAAAALQLAVEDATAIDGLLLAALPVGGGKPAGGAIDRTACPLHLALLGDDASRARSGDVVVTVPDAEALASIAVPVLVVHGGADTVAPIVRARDALSALRTAELVETVDGLHDALNDQSHRSVAASVVLWLERLRAAGVGTPIVRIGSL